MFKIVKLFKYDIEQDLKNSVTENNLTTKLTFITKVSQPQDIFPT